MLRIKKRIENNLFQPANKNLLMNVFNDNGISLMTYEKQCIDARNTFLHGHLDLPILVKGQGEFVNLEIMNNAIVKMLYELVSKRIMFPRPLVNVNKFLFPHIDEFANEEPFIVFSPH